ncbi:hypothetical protein AWB68_03947 [Caballeronia choica]|uniref:PROLIN-rich signal peptide protein n=1 Tax=Caballeronia choica TaxID=326476 RepID=A0A158JKL0_9BURK|nr:DUF3108 domain-containing protein [Caballeronia choica]SAL69416.1 hypothetical protein AWB68_03947 [Caballeronia choica]
MSFFPFRPRATDGAPANTADSRPPRRWARWALVLLAVVALHWSAARWIGGHGNVANAPPVEHVPVQVALLTAKPVEPAAPPPPKPAVPPAPAPRAPVAPRASIAPVAPQPKPAPVMSVARDEPDAQAIAAADAASAAAASQAAAASAASAAAAASANAAAQAAAAPAAPGDKFDVPPTGDLRYDTLVNGMMNQTGTIHWTNDGQHYAMVVSIPIPFIGPFVYSSEGHIDRFGIAPEQYSQQRGRRAADVTIFNRETKQLVYTRTPANQPLADGGQDRFSVFMQLASLVRGSPDTYKPGVTRQFSVADNDSNEIWQFETVGDETVQARGGSFSARHFTRLPRREGDRRRIDVWLAPSLGWLPARILQTEPNGMQIELLWRGKLQPPGAANSTPPDGVETTGPGTPDASDDSAPDAMQPVKP